jgi:hypothetical protein
MIKKLNGDPADVEKDTEIVKRIFIEVQQPLIKMIDNKLGDIKPMFKTCKIQGRYNAQHLEWNMHQFDINARLLLEENVWMLGFDFSLTTFIQGGTKAFNIWQGLEIHLDSHKYMIGPDRGNPWKEKVYRKMLTNEELEEIADQFVENILEEINKQAEKILNG